MCIIIFYSSGGGKWEDEDSTGGERLHLTSSTHCTLMKLRWRQSDGNQRIFLREDLNSLQIPSTMEIFLDCQQYNIALQHLLQQAETLIPLIEVVLLKLEQLVFDG